MFGFTPIGATAIGDGSSSQTAAPTVTGIAVSPSTITLAGSGTQTFTAVVSGTNSPNPAVTWSTNAGTIGLNDGAFIAPAATAVDQTITITATSVQDGTKTGTATVTVLAKVASTLTLTFQDSSNALKTNLTNLSWAFFDQTNPGLLTSPIAKGTTASTNNSGVMTLSITGTALITGSFGYLIVETSDGKFSFAGKVQVT